MPIGFHKECCFCSDEELQPTEPEPSDRLWRLVCIRNYMCPHCFDIFRRPIRPTWITLVAWFTLYVASYFVVTTPIGLVQHQWPDENTQVMRQFVYAPIMYLDPRIHAERMALEKFHRAVETPASDVVAPIVEQPKRTRLATVAVRTNPDVAG